MVYKITLYSYKRHNVNSSKYSADNLAKLILW